uniref:Uncharacterized protein n=1 Tax=Aureoumbra lagunensis TaxID=44058 RepID=A0A7S3NGH3_9STRA|mmetsp:Transcript_23403/g.30382  ORF Transcript_23403/g.30382 Transcript_23403/m.30382 type:complete len:434 (+) Transcript_23403:36-1337(+)
MEYLDSGAGCYLLEYQSCWEICQVACTCTEWQLRSEIAARLRVHEFLMKIGIDVNGKDFRNELGFESEWPWRYMASIYARCALWLRADMKHLFELDNEDRILEWRDCLGSSNVAYPIASAEAPTLCDDTVDFTTRRSGRGLTLSNIPVVGAGAMIVIARVSGDSTIVDSASNDRFELCHGYPTDGNRAQPRICFTACNSGDPPQRGLWGSTRATGQRHAYSLIFGHKSWQRQQRPTRVQSQLYTSNRSSFLTDHTPLTQENYQQESPPRRALRLLGRSNSMIGSATANLRRSVPLPSFFTSRRTVPQDGLGDDDDDELTEIDPHLSPRPPTRGTGPIPINSEPQNRSAALFVDSMIQGCADVGANLIDQGLTLGSDRNGSYRLRGDLSVFALWNGPVPASCLFALERYLLYQHNIKHSSTELFETTRPRAGTA